MGEDDQEFKIDDRRRFDAEGRPRDEVEQETDPTGADLGASAAEGEPGPRDIPVDFSTFILSLGTSAMMHLGHGPNPEGALRKDLAMAKQVIDMLAMLQEKTRGNLSADEAKLLEDLLYDLRLHYVGAAR